MKKKKKYSIPRPYEKLGAYLSDLRQQKQLSQREVSLKLGYSSAQFISNFERGIAAPPLGKLRILLKLYDGSVDQTLNLILDCEREQLRGALVGHSRT